MQRIFVGDVQGCVDEFLEILERARSSFSNDFELWSVGDLVNRGPDNLTILRTMRDLIDSGRGRMVLGNHELGLLQIAEGIRELQPRDTVGDVLEAPDARDWIDWLRGQPLAQTGSFDRPLVGTETANRRSRFVMVHASVHPDWDVPEIESRARAAAKRLADPDLSAYRQFLASSDDPDRDVVSRFTRCRSASSNGEWSSNSPGEDETTPLEAWHEVWTRRRHSYGVVYGHWARQGLHIAPGLRGLDTGCVHHGRGRDGSLTAWLPDPHASDPFATPDTSFWHVPARRAYYAERLAAV